MFNEKEYKQALNSGQQGYYDAQASLERAILKAEIKDAIKLKKLRTPGKITELELQRLKRSGFNATKATDFNGEEVADILVLAFHAGFEHAKSHWPQLTDRYDMSMYPLEGLK